MTNVVPFKPRKAKAKAKFEPMTMDTVKQWIEDDVSKLMKATGKTAEEAIQMASDFYYRYPALVEHVRSEEFMASRK